MSGCSAFHIRADLDCAWAAPIRFSEETKAWLGALEWPETAFADFKQIADHNELYGRFCGTGESGSP
ncbi:MAG TPA: hypothetical protein VD713_00875 [Sphingomonadales bacterium]|nr:hypothetical protein [Sphingomonadales bacterium]